MGTWTMGILTSPVVPSPINQCCPLWMVPLCPPEVGMLMREGGVNLNEAKLCLLSTIDYFRLGSSTHLGGNYT